MKVDEYNVGSEFINAFTMPTKSNFPLTLVYNIIQIKITDFESWLTDKGYMNWINDSSDHNGEHVQSTGKYEDFEEWEQDLTRNEVIKHIEEYLNEQK